MSGPRTEAGKRLVKGMEKDWNTPVLRALAASIRQQVLDIEREAAIAPDFVELDEKLAEARSTGADDV